MNKKHKRYGRRTIRYTKMIAGTAALAVLLTACGGGKAVENKEKTGATDQQQATASTNTSAEQQPGNTTTSKVQPEALAQEMLKGNFSGIYQRFSDPFKEDITEKEFSEMSASFLADVKSFTPGYASLLNGGDQRFWKSDGGDKGITALFDPTGTIFQMAITHLETHPDTDKIQTKIAYELPLHGDWYIFWGGNNQMENAHYSLAAQRYAYDIIRAVDHYSFKGDPLKNESYYAFGQNVLAPADGTVVSVVNDIADNVPVGVMNEKHPEGNVVIIDHGGEYSYLAHLKKGSATVKPGDKVKTGDVIGLLGNSGNSSEPHLHFQVSDGADLFKSHAINIQWKNNLDPKKGMTVTVNP
ncbi:M23 family metallopeptidase [Bacillus sp. FJAT-27264]|uniref:M23 family metallopeptidase n=1 Tax=Paenibacillus sp. (strain DSM 101736 / FJAT-27264) TaxID=1850362 RepID=UPI0009F1EB0A|nr:M23 family metallopeptidase [Bacillus sp. FJAT-27264]